MKIAKNKKLNSPQFTGVITALVTPFKRGKVDFKSLKRLVRQQLDGGVQGFVINGTTGESPTLHADEVKAIFTLVKNESDHSVPLIVGTGLNSTEKTIEATKKAGLLKADAALIVVPYYNKPPQKGLIAHYTAVAKASPLPIILYNVPGRTVISMHSDTTFELSKLKKIVGVKEAAGQLEVFRNLAARVAPHFLLSSGDDTTCVEAILAGGHGVISVISHVIPKEFRALVDRARNKDKAVASVYKKYKNLNKLLGVEANPIPVKMALALMGVIDSPEMRLPLVTMSPENTGRMQTELKALGLI